MPDWDGSEEETKPTTTTTPATKASVPKKTKWEGEDEENDDPADDWDDSSEEEEEKPPAPAPPKKKGTLKQKLAEKEAEKARKLAAAGEDDDDDDDEYDSDEVLDPREKARRDKERQIQADLHNATELLGSAALGGTSSKELDSLISFQPRTKEDFQAFSAKIIEYIIKRHQNKPLYHSFVEHHVRELAAPLKDVEVRKAASALTTLANEKQKEQRDKAAGKKKPKAATKQGASAKLSNKLVDTTVYDEALDDFGENPTDFM